MSTFEHTPIIMIKTIKLNNLYTFTKKMLNFGKVNMKWNKKMMSIKQLFSVERQMVFYKQLRRYYVIMLCFYECFKI